MPGSTRALLGAIFLALAAPASGAAAVASGKHWRLAVEGLRCDAAESLVVAGRLDYLGPAAPVEAPVIRVVDGTGKAIAPRSLVPKGESTAHAQWLARGGLRQLQPGAIGGIELKFDLRGAASELSLELGDIPAFALTGKGGAGRDACASLLRTEKLAVPRKARADATPARMRVYHATYPCLARDGSLKTLEALQPPYTPLQLLVFGRGYLPNAREVGVPSGKAPAQSYYYSGVDNFSAVEAAARKAVGEDFPAYRASLILPPAEADKRPRKHFAFSWGLQLGQTGNELFSIGLYEARGCPGG